MREGRVCEIRDVELFNYSYDIYELITVTLPRKHIVESVLFSEKKNSTCFDHEIVSNQTSPKFILDLTFKQISSADF